MKRMQAYFLLEALVAMVIFAIGMLGIVNLYGKLQARSQDAQFRIIASNYANEAVSMIVADATNSGCYTTPTQGSCSSTMADNYIQGWVAEVQANLPGAATTPPVITIDGNNRISVTINWQRNSDPFAHNHVVVGQL